MPREGHIRELRALVGTRPLILPSVAVIVRRGDEVVVGRHHDIDRWVVPGGGVEPGESPADCAVREVWEETGLTVQLTGFRGTYGGGADHRIAYPNGDICDYVVTVYDAEVVGGELAEATDELLELQWVRLDALTELDLAPWLVAVLEHPDGFEPVTWRPPDHQP